MGSKLTTEQEQSEPPQLLSITEVKTIYSGKNTTEQSSSKLKTNLATVSKKKQFRQLSASLGTPYSDSYDLKQLSNNFVTGSKIRVSEQKRGVSGPLKTNMVRKQRKNDPKTQKRLTTDQRTNYLEELQDMSSELTMNTDSKKFSNNLAKEEKRSDSELLNSNLKTEQQKSEFQLSHNSETLQNKSDSRELHSSLSPEKKSCGSEMRNNNLTSAPKVNHGKFSLTDEKSDYSIPPSINLATKSKKSNLPNSLATENNKNDSGNLSNILTTEQKEGAVQQMGGMLTVEQTKHVSEGHSRNLTIELQKNNSEPQSINLATEQKKSVFQELSDNLTTQQNKKGSGQLHSNLSPEKKSTGSEHRSNSLTSVQGVNYGKIYLATETNSNYSRQPSSNLASEPKKGNLSLQLPSSLATQLNKDSGNLSNILAAELKDSEAEQTRDNLILEQKKNVSQEQSSNLTTLLKKNESDPQSINLATEQRKRYFVLQLPRNFAWPSLFHENKHDSGHLHSSLSPEKNSSASISRSITLTSEQGVKSENLSLATEAKSSYSGELRSNMTTEPKESNLSLQLSNSLTTQQKENDSGNPSNSLTIEQKEQNRNVSQQQSNVLTAEQKNNDSKPSRRNSTTEQKKSDLTGEGRDSQQQATEHEKCYDSQDTSLTFTDEDDGLDFLCEGYKSLRALMSCGHAVTPTSLTNWCHYLFNKGESRFVCGEHDCNAEWTYEEVCKMALLTPEEMEYFETKLFSTAKDYLDVKACPGCKSSVVRTELSDLRVFCTVCTTDRRKIFEFCWQCLREWKDPCQYLDSCGNDGCINKPLEILKTCPDITLKDVRGVPVCPSTRACSTCGLLVVHNGTRCKSMSCPRCKVKFCFLCLRLSVDCTSYFTTCSTGVAPRQTSIPVWKKK